MSKYAVLNCDALYNVIVCVLSHIDKCKKKTIAYGSRTTNKTERIDAMINKEALSKIF